MLYGLVRLCAPPTCTKCLHWQNLVRFVAIGPLTSELLATTHEAKNRQGMWDEVRWWVLELNEPLLHGRACALCFGKHLDVTLRRVLPNVLL